MLQEPRAETSSPPAALPAMGTSPTSHSSCQHLITIAGRKRGSLSCQNCRKELGNVTLAFSSQETKNCTASQDERAQTAPWNCCFLLGDYVFPGAVDFLPSSCFYPVLCLFRVQDKNICMAAPSGPGMRKATGLCLLVCHVELSWGDRHFLQKRKQVCLMVKYLKRRKRK